MVGNPYVIELTTRFFNYLGIYDYQWVGIILVFGGFIASILIMVCAILLCRLVFDGKGTDDDG